MSTETGIAWTNHTFNPWWGCVKVAQGCKNCYAETFSKRTGHAIWGAKADRRFFGDKHWAEPIKWNRDARANGERRRVFCGSMCDVCEDRPDLVGPRKRLVDLIYTTPWLDWQLLTKRPENYTDLFGALFTQGWPLNAWLGASVAEQSDFDKNAHDLACTGAQLSIKFLSCEPLISPVNLGNLHDIDWVIVGGESGANRRTCAVNDIVGVVRQCQAAGVACFVKQDAGMYPGQQGRLPDDVWATKEFPTPYR